MSTRDEETLLRLAKAVAEGTPVDWEREGAAQPALRPQLEKLRAIEGIAALNLEAAPDPLIGKTLSHYRIRERIGAGGMGVVYRAEDRSLRRPVALKVLPPERVASDERRRRLLREARTGAAVVHPSIAAVHEIGEAEGNIFVAMELVEGETLHERIGGRPMPIRETLQIATELAEGLAHAHQARVIHRDLKPANVVVRPDGHVKILDFGLAKLMEEKPVSGLSELSQLETPSAEFTGAGKVMGTPAYMSPEQVRGEPLDARSDLFSFGSTLYTMATGSVPFRGQTPADTLASILRGEPTSPRRLNPEVPLRLEEIIGKCLEKDPKDRYPRANELAAELRALASVSGSGISADRAPGGGSRVEEGTVASARRGYPAMPDSERRLAAILSADAVGYSRLMAEDEAGTIRTLSAYQHEIAGLVEDHRGRVVDVTGDNVLAEFPTALGAVECAVEIQRVLQVRNAGLAPERRMAFRIGAHLGDVAIEGGRVYGDGVNIAARLEGLAEPGGVCISRSVYEAVHGKLDLGFEDLGEQEVKNIPEPVRVYRINLEWIQQPPSPRRRPAFRHWAVGAGAFSLILGAAVAIWRHLEPAPGPPPEAASVAVLMFDNLSRDPINEAFTDGIHDDVLTQISKIHALKVIARTSVERLDPSLGIQEIGRQLGVAAVLEGGVQRAGDRVRINVQLIDCGTEAHLWAETYDRELTVANIFDIQSEIASSVARALRATLSPDEQERLATVPTENLAAYQAYLVGKQRLAKLTSDAVAEAGEHFARAIELDPNFALAHAGMADVYIWQVLKSGLPREQLFAKAQAAANKALELDDRLGEAYASLGLIKDWRFDLEGAEAAYRRALELNPNYATAYSRYGQLLRSELGRSEEALALHRKAIELDPLSAEIIANLGSDLSMLGRSDEALAWWKKALEVDPGLAIYESIADHYWFFLGQLDEAVAWYAKAISLDPGDPNLLALMSWLFLDLGSPSEAESWIERSLELGPEGLWPNIAMAYWYLYRDDEAGIDFARKSHADFPNNLAAQRILRIHALRAGRYSDARAVYEKLFPDLLNDEAPEVDDRTRCEFALDLALILSGTGEGERADWLLERCLNHIETIPRLGWDGYWILDVQIYALRGEKRKALAALRQAIDEGWRAMWWYYLQREPNLESLHGEPEFQSMVEEVRADMAAQLERVREMERRGELPSIPPNGTSPVN